MDANGPLRATDEDVVDGDVDQLDNVANNSHDQEAHANGLGNAEELALVGCEVDVLAE